MQNLGVAYYSLLHIELVCESVRVGQWVTVAGCGSELWTFVCFCAYPDGAEGSDMQPHEGADA